MALKKMDLLRDEGYIIEMPEWEGGERAPSLKVVGIIPKLVEFNS